MSRFPTTQTRPRTESTQIEPVPYPVGKIVTGVLVVVAAILVIASGVAGIGGFSNEDFCE